MKPLKGIRWGRMWVVSHNQQDGAFMTQAATASPVEIAPPSSVSFDREEPETLNSFPACAVYYEPEEAEPFSVIDLTAQGRPGLVRCSTLSTAEQKARRAV